MRTFGSLNCEAIAASMAKLLKSARFPPKLLTSHLLVMTSIRWSSKLCRTARPNDPFTCHCSSWQPKIWQFLKHFKSDNLHSCPTQWENQIFSVSWTSVLKTPALSKTQQLYDLKKSREKKSTEFLTWTYVVYMHIFQFNHKKTLSTDSTGVPRVFFVIFY